MGPTYTGSSQERASCWLGEYCRGGTALSAKCLGTVVIHFILELTL